MSKKNNYYYGKEQEDAIIRYLQSEDPHERELIYKQYLEDPLNKMIESIIRKYNLQRENLYFEELHGDALSFLHTKLHHYNPEQNTKSFSYFGTITRHYLYNEMVKQHKRGNRKVPYEDISTNLEDRPDLTYNIDENYHIDYNDFLSKLSDEIREELLKDDITDHELRVGDSLIAILEDWENIFGKDNKGRAQFNKKLILQILRNRTNLTTKQIRDAMKSRFKGLYKSFKAGYE